MNYLWINMSPCYLKHYLCIYGVADKIIEENLERIWHATRTLLDGRNYTPGISSWRRSCDNGETCPICESAAHVSGVEGYYVLAYADISHCGLYPETGGYKDVACAWKYIVKSSNVTPSINYVILISRADSCRPVVG